MHVELWTSTKGKPRVIAIIRASGGQMQIEEKEPVPKPVREDLEGDRKRLSDDEKFLRYVATMYQGAYYQAALKE